MIRLRYAPPLKASLQQLGFTNITECGDGIEAFNHLMQTPALKRRIEEVLGPLHNPLNPINGS